MDWLITADARDSCIPHENCLGLSGMPVYEPESVCSSDRHIFPAAASTSNPADTQYLNTLHHPFPTDCVVYVWQPPPYHPSVQEETMLDRVGETRMPHPVHMTPPPESHLARELTARSQSKRVDASRSFAPSVTPHSRYTPYALASNITRRGDDVLTPAYPCQWFDGAIPCNEVVSSTKSAIGQHLLDAHAIRLKGDKTTQVCLWEACQKTMRRESIARHILTVHMQDKVLCPSCRLRFARADSMQRHHKTCLTKREAEREASLATGRLC
ncbi:hypothetical protein J3R82DRAFT_2202 [Butyriboletus roseoflavus]|nr:hypothetical protein J3R82DRAFT_2202 [Butyriboletus roseoflavus]